jgi:general secretion pathway protein G
MVDGLMMKKKITGFTLIELLVVMAIIGVLLTIAVPRYQHSVDKSREAVLHENLELTRQVIDKYYGDNGRYPDSLEELVARKYLRAPPFDPVAGNSDAWIIIPSDDPAKGLMFDLKSGAPGVALDGTEYKSW